MAALPSSRTAGAQVRAALEEGKAAMREREAELRAEIARRTG